MTRLIHGIAPEWEIHLDSFTEGRSGQTGSGMAINSYGDVIRREEIASLWGTNKH